MRLKHRIRVFIGRDTYYLGYKGHWKNLLANRIDILFNVEFEFHTDKTTLMAANFFSDTVLPFFDAQKIALLRI